MMWWVVLANHLHLPWPRGGDLGFVRDAVRLSQMSTTPATSCQHQTLELPFSPSRIHVLGLLAHHSGATMRAGR